MRRDKRTTLCPETPLGVPAMRYVAEIALDEEFPEDTFRLELPGVEFQRVDS